TQSGSYRIWMDVGISMTGNNDHYYFGQKAKAELDYTDVVIHWSDNPGKWLMDRLRFIFTSGYDQMATSGATSFEGLEGMRLYPVDNHNVNIDLGDWYAANLSNPGITEPEERLDIVDGRVRIRQLPNDAPDPSLTRLMVVDNNGVVHWKPANSFQETPCKINTANGSRSI